MASDVHRGHFGDSARNSLVCDFKSNSSHIFDAAGENIKCHSDSESLASRKTRYINPAICVETIEATHSVTSLQTDSCIDDVTPHPHSSYRSNSTPFLSGRESSSASSSSVKRKSCRLLEITHHQEINAAEETPRFNRTYREDGSDTFRLSVASLSTTTTAKEERERHEKKKQEAFRQWCARKEQEKREKLRLEKMKLQQPLPSTTPEQREESYRRWLERKRKQLDRRRAEEIMKQYTNNEKIEQERMKKEREREEKLSEWIKKKEEEIKVMKTRDERKAARIAIEAERRRAKNERAYRDWIRTSKNKPLPVPLNKGELSMRGSVSQMFINPVPWQSPT